MGKPSHTAEARAIEDKTIEDKTAEGKAIEGKAIEGRAIEGRAIEDKAIEDKTAEGKAIEDKAMLKLGLLQSAGKILIALFLILPSCLLANFDHGSWDKLLKNHVIEINGGVATQVDYSAMAAEREILTAYLESLAKVKRESFDSWPNSSQLAFLLNAYNAWTVELILREYPDIDSIRDIGFIFPRAWSQEIASLFGELHTLDDIEHGMIRGWDRYREPRIHFAANCAAIACPALRVEAYKGEKLEQQLEENTKLFLSDRTRNYYSNGRLYVSSIFDWYEEDFEKGWQGINSVAEFLANYSDELQLDSTIHARLLEDKLPIRHLRYDWDLNDVAED